MDWGSVFNREKIVPRRNVKSENQLKEDFIDNWAQSHCAEKTTGLHFTAKISKRSPPACVWCMSNILVANISQ